MSHIQRVRSFVSGLLMLLAVLVLMLAGSGAAPWIVGILAVSLILRGLRSLLYYFTMARFMVGGLTSLFIGVFLVDFGVLSISLADEAKVYILLYLAGWNAFSGLISLLRARESVIHRGRSWWMDTLYGLVNISVLTACILYRDSPDVLTFLYCGGAWLLGPYADHKFVPPHGGRIHSVTDTRTAADLPAVPNKKTEERSYHVGQSNPF